jgi:hypothetical protein
MEARMEATVVDLRYRMNEVLKALKRREKVTLLYHGKVKGAIVPASTDRSIKVGTHPFFGMTRKDKKSVNRQMKELRGARFNDL